VPPPLAQELGRAGELLGRGDRVGARRPVRRVFDTAPAAALGQLADLGSAEEDLGTAAVRRGEVRWVAPSSVTVRPTGPQPGASQRAARRTNAGAVAASYLTERGGVDDVRERDSRPAGYGIDYDLAAVPPLRGSACLGWGLERSRADQARGDVLCEGCREDGLTTESAMAGRGAAILARDGARARVALRALWRRLDAGRPWQALAAWVAANDRRVPATARDRPG
jgi:hypothetical protein